MTEDELSNIFSAYGNIVQMNLLKDKITGMPRGVAFVRFDRREEALSAIDHLNGTIPHGRTNPISVKIAEEHGKQKAAYFAGWEAGRQQARCKANYHLILALLYRFIVHFVLWLPVC